MAKGKREIDREILEGLREIKSRRHGRVVNLPSVASVRAKTGLSQERFATLLGVSIRTLQDWEQGWRRAVSLHRGVYTHGLLAEGVQPLRGCNAIITGLRLED
jgi:DNA-binding XRE family transcriptional regulator